MMITAFFSALLALLYICLAYNIVRLRRSKSIGLGSGGDAQLKLAMRAQSNFIEYVPLALLLIFFVEQQNFSGFFVHILAITLLFARAYHAFGYLRSSGGYSKGRFFGTLFTWVVIVVAALSTLGNQLYLGYSSLTHS